MAIEIVKVSAATIVFAVLFHLLQRKIRREKKWIAFTALMVLKAVLTAQLSYFLLVFDSVVTWRFTFITGGFYLAILADLIRDILLLIFTLIRKKELFQKLSIVFSVLCTGAVLIYSVVNMQVVVPEHLTLSSDKLQTEHRFVFMADLHYGTAQRTETFDQTLRDIEALKPEFILLGGDITDERTTKEEMQEVYAKLGKLDIPVYFIYGNHDRQEHADEFRYGRAYMPEELEAEIEKNGITILRDQYIRLADDLILLGREDKSHPEERVKEEDLPERPGDGYVICVDHDPGSVKHFADVKADLQLGGHTHAGQFFPMRWGGELTGNYLYGLYHVGDTELFVTAGAAGWAIPVRTEGHCAYTIVTLQP